MYNRIVKSEQIEMKSRTLNRHKICEESNKFW